MAPTGLQLTNFGGIPAQKLGEEQDIRIGVLEESHNDRGPKEGSTGRKGVSLGGRLMPLPVAELSIWCTIFRDPITGDFSQGRLEHCLQALCFLQLLRQEGQSPLVHRRVPHN